VQHERDGQRKTLFLGPIQEQHTNKKGKWLSKGAVARFTPFNKNQDTLGPE
jgi:hypothetical protein